MFLEQRIAGIGNHLRQILYAFRNIRNSPSINEDDPYAFNKRKRGHMQTPPVEKKEQSLMAKILLLVLAGMAIAIFGFISLIIAALAGGERFFTPYLLILGVGLELLFAGHLFQIFSPLHRRRMAALFLGGMLVLVAGHLSWQAYLDSIPKVDANDVKLWLYEPHREGTMAASLDKTSTLKLDGSFPVWTAPPRCILSMPRSLRLSIRKRRTMSTKARSYAPRPPKRMTILSREKRTSFSVPGPQKPSRPPRNWPVWNSY